MSKSIAQELTIGCEDAPDIKCGIIGEIGCSWPLYGDYYGSFIQTVMINNGLKLHHLCATILKALSETHTILCL